MTISFQLHDDLTIDDVSTLYAYESQYHRLTVDDVQSICMLYRVKAWIRNEQGSCIVTVYPSGGVAYHAPSNFRGPQTLGEE